MQQQQWEKSNKTNIIVLSAMISIGLMFALLLGIYPIEGGIYRYHTLIFVLLFIITLLFGGVSFTTYYFRKETPYKIFVMLFLFFDLAEILLFLLSVTGFLSVVHDAESFEKYLESAGIWMSGVFILLQYLQVLILPIPGIVTIVAGTAIFGAKLCFLYSYIAIVLGSLSGFFIGKGLGFQAVAWLLGEKKLNGWLDKMQGKDTFLLTAMFVLPFFPDDILCFVAGLSTMSFGYFTAMILIVRAFSIGTTCFSLHLIPFDTPWGIACWIGIAIVTVLSVILFYRYKDAISQWFNRKFHKKERAGKELNQTDEKTTF